MVGDAELDEGNVGEALGEEVVARLGNVLWIVDVNRQCLDRIVPDGRLRQLADMFEAGGWRVDELRWGRKLAGPVRASRAASGSVAGCDAATNAEYQRLLRLPAGGVAQGAGHRRRRPGSIGP